jgi:hypothetical protein
MNGQVNPGCSCGIANPFPVTEWAQDSETAEKLWKLSEKLVGQQFAI